MQNSKAERRKRSRAITAIVKEIGRYNWSKLPIDDKKTLIKKQISKIKKTTKKERQIKKQTNKNIYLSRTDDGHIDYDEVAKICKSSQATFTEREQKKVSWAEKPLFFFCLKNLLTLFY